MTLHILMLTADKLFAVINKDSAVVIPVTATRFIPYLPSSEKLFELVDKEKLENKISQTQEEIDQAIIFSSNALKKQNIKYIVIKSVDLQTVKNRQDIQLALSEYYQKSVQKALSKAVKDLTIPFIKYQSSMMSLEDVVTHSLAEIQKIVTHHPDLKLNLVIEDNMSFQVLMRIKDLILLKADITDTTADLDTMQVGQIVPLRSRNFDSSSVAEEEKKEPCLDLTQSDYNGHDHSQINVSSPHDFMPEPYTPVELKANLMDKKLVFESAFSSAYAKKWESISNKAILALKKADVLDVNELNFYLGPAIYPLRCHYENGSLRKLEWDLHKLNGKKSYLTRALDGIEIYCKYLEHTHLFLFSQDEFGKTTQKFKEDYVILREKYTEEIKKGLQRYQDWTVQKQALFFGKEFPIKWKQIQKADSYNIDKMKEHLKHVLIEYINTWLEEVLYASPYLDAKTIKMFQGYFNQIEKILLKTLDKEVELRQISKLIKQEVVVYSTAIKSLEAEQTRVKVAYEAAVATEVSDYQTFADSWLSSDDNYVSVYDELLSCNDKDSVGLTREQLVTSIIQFNSNKTAVRHHNTIKIFCKKEKDDKNSQKFQAQLQKHYINTEFYPLIMAAKLFHTILEKQQMAALLTRDENEKIALSAIADNTSMLLHSCNQSPLSWHELTQILSGIACKSEAQQSLKMKLQSFIDYRDPGSTYNYLNTLLFNNDQLLERRRQVNYLVSCLHFASALQRDGGIIFKSNGDHEDNVTVGVDLILKNMKQDKIKSSLLKNLLESFLDEIHSKTILYIAEEKDDVDNPMLNSPEIADNLLKKSAQKHFIILPIYESVPIELRRSAELLHILGIYKPEVHSPSLSLNNNHQSQHKIKMAQGR